MIDTNCPKQLVFDNVELFQLVPLTLYSHFRSLSKRNNTLGLHLGKNALYLYKTAKAFVVK